MTLLIVMLGVSAALSKWMSIVEKNGGLDTHRVMPE